MDQIEKYATNIQIHNDWILNMLYVIYVNVDDFVVKCECRRAYSMLCLITLFLFRLFYAFCMMIVKRTYLFMQKWFYDERNYQQMDASVIRRSRCFHVQYACKSMYIWTSNGHIGLRAKGYGPRRLYSFISCIIIHYWVVVQWESIENWIGNTFVIFLYLISWVLCFLSLTFSERSL